VVAGLRTLDVVASENVAVPLVGGDSNEDIDIGPEPEDTELLDGDDGRELYRYPVVLPRFGVDRL
jgi:hypothetical protein